MPNYRKTYIKSIESQDINDMPDDFTRLTWLMLPLVLCRDGRGLDNASWLRAKLYPLRDDVTLEMAQAAMDWLAERGMIRRYTVNGRGYFFVPTWYEYQTGTEKEAKSPYPQPPIDLLSTNSRQTTDKEPTRVNVDDYVNASVYASESVSVLNMDDENSAITPFMRLSEAFVLYSGLPELTGGAPRWTEGIRGLVDIGATPELVKDAIQVLRDKRYNINGPKSIHNTVINLLGEKRGLQPSNNGGGKPNEPAGFAGIREYLESVNGNE